MSSGARRLVDGVSANIGIGVGQETNPDGTAGGLGSYRAMGGTNSLVSVYAMQGRRLVRMLTCYSCECLAVSCGHQER